MSAVAWLVVAGVVLVLLLWVAWTLTRLRRLARRVQLAWSALDVLLQRRAAVVGQALGQHAGQLGPEVGRLLADAVADLGVPAGGDREAAENHLARSLRRSAGALAQLPAALREELADTGDRVGLARSFYNDAVHDTRSLRRSRSCRALRLHARRPLPRYFDIDDGTGAAVPAGGAGG